MADERTYIKVHDGMPEHPKVEALDDDAAAWLLLSAWAYCSRHTTDGQIPKVKAHRLTKGASPARCRKLLAAALLHDGPSECCPDPRPDHYYCHDYLQHQRSVEHIEAMREQRRSAGRNGGLAKGRRVAKRVAKQTASKTEAVLEVTPYGVTQTVTEEPTSGGALRASAALVPIADRPPDAGTVVAAYVDAVRSSAGPLDNRAKGRIAKDAAALLADGAPVALLIDAAQRLAVNGYADLGAEARRLHGERSVTPIRRPSASEAAANAALEAGARVAARHAAQEGA